MKINVKRNTEDNFYKLFEWGRAAMEERGLDLNDWVYISLSHYYLAQCSLAQVSDMLLPRGYVLLHVEHVYAVFVQRDLGLVATQAVHDEA